MTRWGDVRNVPPRSRSGRPRQPAATAAPVRRLHCGVSNRRFRPRHQPVPAGPPRAIDSELQARLLAVRTAGWALWDEFEERQAGRSFHPFVNANYDVVCEALWRHRGEGLRFLEWGSATGVITVMADLMGFEAYGIELDPRLVEMARGLAARFDSGARFVAGSFFPTGYRYRTRDGDTRTGTLGTGESGYLQLGLPLDAFDVVFGYPWDGEQDVMLDLMRQYGRADALFLVKLNDEVVAWRGGRRVVEPPAAG